MECALLCFPCAGGFRNPECGHIMISVFKTRSSGFRVLKAMSGSSVDWVFSRWSFSNWHISLIGDRTGISQPTPGRIMTPLTITYMKAQARVHCISIEFINVIRTRECTYVRLNFLKKNLIWLFIRHHSKHWIVLIYFTLCEAPLLRPLSMLQAVARADCLAF